MPDSPTIEPTERSMPPVMMTKVMPIARNALSATCFDMMIMLAVLQEIRRGEGEEDQDHANRAMKVRMLQQQHHGASLPAAPRGLPGLAMVALMIAPLPGLACVTSWPTPMRRPRPLPLLRRGENRR